MIYNQVSRICIWYTVYRVLELSCQDCKIYYRLQNSHLFAEPPCIGSRWQEQSLWASPKSLERRCGNASIATMFGSCGFSMVWTTSVQKMVSKELWGLCNASHSMHLHAIPTGIRSLTQCLEETLIRVFFLHVFNLGNTFPKLVLYKSGRTAIRPRGASPFCGRHWLSPHCNCPWLVQEGMKTAPMNWLNMPGMCAWCMVVALMRAWYTFLWNIKHLTSRESYCLAYFFRLCGPSLATFWCQGFIDKAEQTVDRNLEVAMGPWRKSTCVLPARIDSGFLLS